MIVKFKAVMHVRPNEPAKVITLGNKVSQYLTDNAATFPNVTNDPAALLPEVNKLEDLQGLANGGSESDTANRDAQSQKVYDMLFANLDDVDDVAQGDKSIVLLSGYDANEEPQNKVIPGVPSIKVITDGPFEHSAKIQLDGFERGAMHIIEYREVGANEWKLGVQDKNTHKLIITGLTRAREIEIRCADQNTAGKGNYTSPTTFLPR